MSDPSATMFSMKATDRAFPGFERRDLRSPRQPAAYHAARSDEVLVKMGEGRTAWFALNPYSGCEFGCAWCQARQQPPFRDADYRLFERDIHARTNAADALLRAVRDGRLGSHPLVLGTTCDPWQPAERRFEVTRRVLEVAANHGVADVRAQTRSTLATRDADLLVAIGRRGRASLAFSIASRDHKLSRLLEPLAPTPERRLAAMEAMARSGVRVGILVAPVLAGLNDSLPALERLLRSARDFGASFAGGAPLSMRPEARARLVRQVSLEDPERATRFDRLLARSAEREHGFAEVLAERFAEACDKVGLTNVWARRTAKQPASASPAGEPQGRQLSLF